MRPAPGHVILLTIIIGPWTEQHQSVTSDHSSATIQPGSMICLYRENLTLPQFLFKDEINLSQKEQFLQLSWDWVLRGARTRGRTLGLWI